ncbi:acyltransferase [Aeromicrobium wangtongii]|uniref:Acyltransferase n=1 Tax=Aeromicrobium wangtongii TaxID=2969247 RepID=A0ABY5M7Y9_9ACTN|nr:acyltransferase [Aeromicrobium wangtongii]MCD9196759.1 acyltransferase [Aeromicrobium wangtongii]UUP14269.1 acyltransferase [Aeromicrobium wangtongii]
MHPTANPALTPAHRERLRSAGVEAAALDGQEWTRLTEGLPDWWHDLGNALYLADRAWLPEHVVASLGIFPVKDVLIVVGAPMEWLSSLLVGGDSATVFLGRDVVLTAGELYCGVSSAIVLHGPVVGTRSAIVDARNGGSVVAGPDQLWAANVYIATDDMHRLEDRSTGQRLNPFGADIRLGSHVWLGREAVVTGHVQIGDGSVVGMRSLVRGQKVPAHTVVAGTPARVVREDVTWSHDDVP